MVALNIKRYFIYGFRIEFWWVTSEHRYKDDMYEFNEKREALIAEISALEDEMANQKPISVGDLSFTEKKAIIKKVITKIVATKQEISIWGRIPLLATPPSGTIIIMETGFMQIIWKMKVRLD